MLDPCAGDGAALTSLCYAWRNRAFKRGRAAVCGVGVELEGTRYRAMMKGSGQGLSSIQGDAFNLEWDTAGSLVDVLYLNPPYDTDPEHGRLEAKWLRRFKYAVKAGGALLLIVPESALAALAEPLAKHFVNVQAFRFPEPEYSAFGQLAIRARRGVGPSRDHRYLDEVRRELAEPRPWESIASGMALNVELPGSDHPWKGRMRRYDPEVALAAWRPFEGTATGPGMRAADLVGSTYETAMPPKPAHLAMALAAGYFNGQALQPNATAPKAFPPILIKGQYYRRRVMIEESDDPEKPSFTEVERPGFTLWVQRLDNFEFVEPVESIDITTADKLEKATAADVIENYSQALADLMAQQFIPIYDPRKPEHCFPLPGLKRKPLRPQAERIRASLMLMASRPGHRKPKNPKLLCEVGTGKTTMAVFIAALLHPSKIAATTASLRTVPGFEQATLPVIRRTRVVCPPHMVSTWVADELPAIWPEARVTVIEDIHGEKVDADFYVINRETAKLGHGRTAQIWTPRIGGSRCPRCGASLPALTVERAGGGLQRCANRPLLPINAWATIVERLAYQVLRINPTNQIAGHYAAHHRVLMEAGSKARGRVSRPIRASEIEQVALAVLDQALLPTAKGGLAPSDGDWHRVASIFRRLALVVRSEDSDRYATMFWRLREAAAGTTSTQAHALAGTVAELPNAYDSETQLVRIETAFDQLCGLGKWADDANVRPCGEPLYQASAPRRYSVAKWLSKRAKDRFDLTILDEAHEFNNQGTAQQKAAHRLIDADHPSIILTGSIMSGYASSLFANWWAMDRDFREHFGREDKAEFTARYGLLKYLRTPPKPKRGEALGAVTDRELWNSTVIGEAPGIVPLFLLRHLLPTGIVMHIDDLDAVLPPIHETDHRLRPETDTDHEMMAEYTALEEAVAARIKADMFGPLTGKLFGALGEVPSYLDRCTEDLGPFEVRYPENCRPILHAMAVEEAQESGNELPTYDPDDDEILLVHRCRMFPASYITPKERWLIASVADSIARGEKVVVFVRHTGSSSRLPRRLADLLAAQVTPSVVYMQSSKPPATKRKDWIVANVIEKGVQVLICNPKAVRTGLNVLTAFSGAIWYEQPAGDALTYRQANGRFRRIGQTKEVFVRVPWYGATTQHDVLSLVARKVTSSLQVDGLTMQGALEAAGVGEDENDAAEQAMNFGRAIYARLVARRSAAA